MAHECEQCGQECYCDMEDMGGQSQPHDCKHFLSKWECDQHGDWDRADDITDYREDWASSPTSAIDQFAKDGLRAPLIDALADYDVARDLQVRRAAISDLRAEKDLAYAERNKAVAGLARMALASGLVAGVRLHEGADWDDDWRTVLFIDLPTGQVSWHFHDSERALLDGLPAYDGAWDGHSTDEKWERVARLRSMEGAGP